MKVWDILQQTRDLQEQLHSSYTRLNELQNYDDTYK